MRWWRVRSEVDVSVGLQGTPMPRRPNLGRRRRALQGGRAGSAEVPGREFQRLADRQDVLVLAPVLDEAVADPQARR